MSALLDVQPMFDSVHALHAMGYNHDGRRGLPIRPDSSDYFTHKVCHGFGDTTGLSFAFSLTSIGELRIAAENGKRTLEIVIPCEGIIEYRKETEDGAEIEGTIRVTRKEAMPEELPSLIRWLKG